METALEAVKNGDARLSAFLLKSIKQGGSLLQQHTALLRDQLNESEKEYQQKVEILTRDMNELYKQEEDMKKEKRKTGNKETLVGQWKGIVQSKEGGCKEEISRDGERDEGSWEENERISWWVPVYGTYLVLREVFDSNTTKYLNAYKEMQGYARDMERAETDIAWVNSAIWEVRL